MNKLSLIQKIQRFFKLESAGGILLLFSAVVAMLLANSPLNQNYNDFLNLPVSIQVGNFFIDKTLIHWINDGFMAVFFVLVGRTEERRGGGECRRWWSADRCKKNKRKARRTGIRAG